MTLQERMGQLKGKKLCLTWTWNPQPLSTAVANSVVMIATKYGMNVSLLCPSPEYVLDERFMKAAQENAAASGGQPVCDPRDPRRLRGRGRGLREQLGSAAVLRGPGEGMEPVEGLRALHRRRRKDGHDQQGDLQPLPAGAPQCRGDRCGPGRSELRGDRRGGEPATRAESADAEAAGGCGSFNIETTPIDVNEAADIERAVSALCSGECCYPSRPRELSKSLLLNNKVEK